MGSLAQLGKQAGMRVTGCDANVYPPMSTQLERAGIELIEGFSADQIALQPDLWVVGNAISRGNPLIEAILESGDRYISGPQFLAEQVLPGKHVLAVSGTHGKTTSSSMLAQILDYAGLQPGFLIGGVPADFGESARLGEGDFFVVEADEYDTAFFDKRSKFVHYRPRTLVINNLEFDHADIFENLGAIQKQFHHLIRTIPAKGSIFSPSNNQGIEDLFAMGCWSNRYAMSSGEFESASSAYWHAEPLSEDCSRFNIYSQGSLVADIDWQLIGEHNMRNALGAIAAATDAGVEPKVSTSALSVFKGVKRRLELVAESELINLYDDFAHHPTAIATTLDGLRAKVGLDKIIAVIEPRSFTMKQGIHKDTLADSVVKADRAMWYQPQNIGLSLKEALSSEDLIFGDIDQILEAVSEEIAASGQDAESAVPRGKTHVLVMSNGGFAGIHQKLKTKLAI